MALSLDPDRLSEEVMRAEDFRRKHTALIVLIMQRFVGNWFRVDVTGEATPENLAFAYVAYMLPELAYTSPTCRVSAQRPLSDQQIADWMEMYLTSWMSAGNIVEHLQDVVRDMLMGYGVMMVGIEPRDNPGPARSKFELQEGQGGQEGAQSALAGGQPVALKPFTIRLPPDTLILDPRCETPEDARFMGHSYWMDLEDLQSDSDMWPPDKVAQLSAASATAEDDNVNEQPFRKGLSADRMRINLIDLWVPEHQMLVTLARTANQGAAACVLRMETYWGPPEGPYEIFGCYRAPGDPYPLGVLQAVMEQLEELWAHQSQASDEAINFKRITLVEAAAHDAQKAIMEGTSGGVYTINGLGNKVTQVDLGGSPQGRMEHVEMVRARVDRTIGLSDAQRGLARGGTATENDIVQNNADLRVAYLRSRVQMHVARVLSRVGWYGFYDPAISQPVSRQDPITGQQTQGMFLGGIQQGQDGIEWLHFRLTIEPQSMQHADDQVLQQRSMETIQVMAEVGQYLQTMPYMNWRYALNMWGESFNQKHLADILINQQALMHFGQMQQAFGFQQQQGLPPGVGPGPLGAGLGMPTGPGPQWVTNGIGGNFNAGGGGGGMPGAPMLPPGGGGAMPMMPPRFGGGGMMSAPGSGGPFNSRTPAGLVSPLAPQGGVQRPLSAPPGPRTPRPSVDHGRFVSAGQGAKPAPAAAGSHGGRPGGPRAAKMAKQRAAAPAAK